MAKMGKNREKQGKTGKNKEGFKGNLGSLYTYIEHNTL